MAVFHSGRNFQSIPADHALQMSHMKILEFCSVADNITSTVVIFVEI
jgi:hypothetical protein